MTTLDEPRTGTEPAGVTGGSTARAGRSGWWTTAWFALGAWLGAGALGDNSFLTHLATGRLIWEEGPPRVDPYSFTRGGAEWVVQSWGASWAYAGLERAVGAGAIRLLVGVTAGALLAVTWRLTRPAGELVGRVGVVAIAAAAQFGGWSERPQVFAFLLLALVVLVLVEDRPAWLLVPLLAVWVNVHGSFPVGLLAVGLVGVGLWSEGACRVRRVAVTGAAAAVGALAGALVSPYGVRLLTFPVELLGRSEVLRYIEEWRRPSLGEPTAWFALGLVAMALAGVLRRRAWGWLPLIVVFAAMGAMSRRNLVLAAIVLVPVAARGLAGLGSLPVAPGPGRRRVAAVTVAVVVALGAWVAVTPDYDLDRYPVAAVAWMDDRGLVGDPEVHVVTHDVVGNYLEWRLGAGAEVFLDDRAELFGEQIVADYTSLLAPPGQLDPGWQATLDRYDAAAVLWREGDAVVGALEDSPAWRLAYRDGGWVVACRVAADLRC